MRNQFQPALAPKHQSYLNESLKTRFSHPVVAADAKKKRSISPSNQSSSRGSFCQPVQSSLQASSSLSSSHIPPVEHTTHTQTPTVKKTRTILHKNSATLPSSPAPAPTSTAVTAPSDLLLCTSYAYATPRDGVTSQITIMIAITIHDSRSRNRAATAGTSDVRVPRVWFRWRR